MVKNIVFKFMDGFDGYFVVYSASQSLIVKLIKIN